VTFGALLAATSAATLDAPKVDVEALDGTRSALDLDGLELDSLGPERALLRFPAGAAPRTPDGTLELRLRAGDRVLGRPLGGGEERLELELVGGMAVGFALEDVDVLFADADRERLAGLAPAEGADRLWRRAAGGYDKLDGFLLGFAAEGVEFEGELGVSLVPWPELAALYVVELEPFEAGDSTGQVAVDLVDGSRLRGAFAGLSEGILHLDRGGDAPLELAVGHLLQLALEDPRQVFLGALPFEELGPGGLFGDGFGLPWPPRVDEAVGGGSLRVGGTVHARGLGVHAPSRLAFDLEPGGLLRGAVGIDDSVLDLPAEGSVVFRLHWNGAAVWESATLSSGDAPVGLPALDLSAGGRLELEADPTDDSIPGDRANWLDLRVVRP